ncbi:M48 metallopeptidase family protein [Roseateles paludis]|jgi:predicted metal-dependent hydrolase|uniref:YgjP-like metallopeptidase domain-containing protein n=1 Tax=Roseateles paludis TaxID=3145238 RepID=A0ABV0G0E5_9BURK
MLAARYLAGYAPELIAQAERLHLEGRLADYLARRLPEPHGVRDDAALFAYVQELKARHLRNASPLQHVGYDAKLRVLQHALGTHTRRTQVQGSRLKMRREIRVASLFKQAPAALLRMIVVHELAHLRELEHNKAFYQLCQHMEPDYAQLEFDLRLYLMHLDAQRKAEAAP